MATTQKRNDRPFAPGASSRSQNDHSGRQAFQHPGDLLGLSEVWGSIVGPLQSEGQSPDRLVLPLGG